MNMNKPVSKDALEGGDLQKFGELMNTHWEHKKGRSRSMSNDRINHWYDLAIRNALKAADIRSDKGTHASRTAPDTVEITLDLTKFGIDKDLVSPALTVSSVGYATQICHG